MRTNKLKSQNGYTLIEIAISIMVIGILLTPAAYMYSLYKKNQVIEKTDDAVLEAREAVTGFVELYGRYPCPARFDAAPNTADYGIEWVDGSGNCLAVAGGVIQTTSNNAGLANPDVYIGSLPFRAMNIPEYLTYDGYGNRLTYAVTDSLTQDTTFDTFAGGISIVDLDDNSLIEPADSAHFVVLSHNESELGAYTRYGVLTAPCPASTNPEEENCNNTATFRVDQVESDFDDLVVYYTADGTYQWQISNEDPQDIHLRRAERLALGANETEDLTAVPEGLRIKDISSDADTSLKATADPADSLNGDIRIGQICSEDGTECFTPRLVGGELGQPGEGMECPNANEFVYKVADGQVYCTDEVFFNCPSGTYLKGFNSNGQMECSDTPALPCADKVIASSCGPSRTVSSFLDGDQYYGYAYSGTCYNMKASAESDLINITEYRLQQYENGVWPWSTFDYDQLLDYIEDGSPLVPNSVNETNERSSSRTEEACGPDASTGLVRDTFECVNQTWNETPVFLGERLTVAGDFGSGPFDGNEAEVNGPTYDPADPMDADSNNTDYTHDCWCREDYRLERNNCAANLTGQQFRIVKTLCPQTHSSNKETQTVYPTSGSWDTSLCVCQNQSGLTDRQSCTSYFRDRGDSMNGEITGEVEITYDISCSGGNATRTVTNVDTSACRCPSRDDDISSSSCPSNNTSNSESVYGSAYKNKSQVRTRSWVCPAGTNVSNGSQGGYYGAPTAQDFTCSCNSNATKRISTSCPPGQSGNRFYDVPFDCVSNTYEDPAPQYEDTAASTCRPCVWSSSSEQSGTSDTAGLVELGGACDSCGATKPLCHVSLGSGRFKLYNGCTCKAE